MASKQVIPLAHALALLACRPDAASTHAGEATPMVSQRSTDAQAQPQPTHLLLPWDATLLTSPHTGAPALQIGLVEASSPDRGVVVIGRDGDFWQVETTNAQALAAFAAPPIEGLDYYRLRLYVPVGEGEPLRPIPPGPDTEAAASDNPDPARACARALAEAQQSGILGVLMAGSGNPPIQTEESRPFGSTTDFRVSPSTPVYWRDGRLAGEVVVEHAFVHPGSLFASPSGELRCFAIRVGATLQPDDGELCFASASVRETEFVPEPSIDEIWGDASLYSDADVLGGLIGAEIGDAWGEGGFGLVGTSTGGGGAGGGVGEVAIGRIATPGRGGDGTSSEITVTTLDATGSMDGDIGRRIVRAHRDELDACWASHAGEVEVELSLDVDDGGNVTASKAVSQPAALGDCIEGATATWSFPAQLPGTLVVRIGF